MSDVKVSYRAILEDMVTGPLAQMAGAGQAAFGRMDKAQDRVQRGNNALANSFSSLKNAVLGGLAIGSIFELGRAVIDTTSKFQTLQSVLANTLGSDSAAQQLFKDIQDFSKTTPYQIDELTESAVKLANRGIVPTMSQMTKMGDLAATLGKPFADLNEAMLDVSNTERWTELGIKVSKSGNKMTGTFRGVSMTVDATEKGALSMVEAFGQMPGVAGSMAAIAETTGGKLSNLKDAFTNLAGEIGEALKPAIDFGITLFSNLASKFSEVVGFFRANSYIIEQVFAPVMGFLEPIIAAFQNLIQQLGLANETGNIMAGVFNFVGNVFEYLRPTLEAFGQAIGTIITSFVQVGQAFADFYRNSSTLQGVVQGIGRFFSTTFQNIANLATGLFGGLADIISGALSLDAGKIGEGIGKIGQGFNAYKDPMAEALYGKDYAGKDFFSGGVAKKSSAVPGGAAALEDARSRLAAQMGSAGSPGDSGSSSGRSSGLGSIEGGSQGRQNIVVNIDRIVGIENLVSQTVQGGTERLREEITRILLSAINDVSITANG